MMQDVVNCLLVGLTLSVGVMILSAFVNNVTPISYYAEHFVKDILAPHDVFILIDFDHVVVPHLDFYWFSLLCTAAPMCVCPACCRFIKEIFVETHLKKMWGF